LSVGRVSGKSPVEKGRVLMPTYEFRCKSCGKVFTEEQSIAEHEKRTREHTVTCPVCGSLEVAVQISEFEVRTASKA
jgi:putative FmdB family regulatory protein